ncbi:hypothetical protein J43TS3_26600 [Ornithinibacillus bavariensis]|uniref:Uncharacterized protein n=1 Tax=Ornithinibacillus bavariensis TaxID=545502 RepID=A0A919XAH4_9BACI|nr:hypothetical protein J43TS3_26600 [Ornithinibacillus bavariensis]
MNYKSKNGTKTSRIYRRKNYFDNEQKAISFMNEIDKHYENDVLREKKVCCH